MKTNDLKEMSKENTFFYMVDMQNDFVKPGGALYVPKAETLISTIQKLQGYARKNGIREYASVDNHFYSDAEISDNPTWSTTFPPHCMDGTVGQKIVDELTIPDVFPIVNKIDEKGTKNEINIYDLKSGLTYNRNVVFSKQSTDVTTNPHFAAAMSYLKSEGVRNVVVYGVATDYCVKDAVSGLLANGLDVFVAQDAITGIVPENCKKTLDDFITKNVKLIQTSDLLSQ
jgi:nicotinamidase/pyrazinamidase